MYFKSLLNSIRQLSFFDTFKHASTYFSGTVLVQLLGLFTLPIFTAYLTEEEYGIINIFSSLVNIVTVLITLNVHCATERYYHEDKDDYPQFLGSVFVFANALFLVLSTILLYFADTMSTFLDIPSSLIKWLVLYTYFGMLCHGFFNNIMIATKQSKKYTFVHLVWQYLKFGAIVGFLMFWDYKSYDDIYMAKIIGEGAIGVIVVAYTTRVGWQYMKFNKFRWKHIKYAISFGFPLIPFSLSLYLLATFDQLFINIEMGKKEAGLYSFAYKIGMIYTGLGVALMKGASPEYYKKMNEKDYAGVAQQADSMTKLLVIGGGFLILYAVDVGTFLTSSKNFLVALPIAPVIVMGYLFHAIASFYNRGIFYTKKNIYLSGIIMASVVLNVILNIWLIPMYNDYKIAAYTTLISYIFMMILSIIVTTYILKLPPLPLGKFIKYIVLLAIIVALNYLFGAPNTGLHIGWMMYKGILFLVLVLALFYNKIGLILNKK